MKKSLNDSITDLLADVEELQRKVLEIVKDGEWRMAKEIMELLPDDLKPVSVTALAKMLFKMCDRGELQL